MSRDARSNTAKQLHGLGPLGPPPEGNTSCYQPIDGLTRSPVAMAPKTPAEPIVTYFALTRTCNIHLAMSAPPPLQRRHLLLCGVLGGASGRFVCVIAVIVNFKDIRSVSVGLRGCWQPTVSMPIVAERQFAVPHGLASSCCHDSRATARRPRGRGPAQVCRR